MVYKVNHSGNDVKSRGAVEEGFPVVARLNILPCSGRFDAVFYLIGSALRQMHSRPRRLCIHGETQRSWPNVPGSADAGPI